MKTSILVTIFCLAVASNGFAAGGQSADHKPADAGSKGQSADHKPADAGSKGQSADKKPADPGSQADAHKPADAGSKGKGGKVDRVALKACMDSLNQQLSSLRPQLETACVDEASSQCVALKEQISALNSQRKDCRSPAPAPAPAPAPVQ